MRKRWIIRIMQVVHELYDAGGEAFMYSRGEAFPYKWTGWSINSRVAMIYYARDAGLLEVVKNGRKNYLKITDLGRKVIENEKAGKVYHYVVYSPGRKWRIDLPVPPGVFAKLLETNEPYFACCGRYYMVVRKWKEIAHVIHREERAKRELRVITGAELKKALKEMKISRLVDKINAVRGDSK